MKGEIQKQFGKEIYGGTLYYYLLQLSLAKAIVLYSSF